MKTSTKKIFNKIYKTVRATINNSEELYNEYYNAEPLQTAIYKEHRILIPIVEIKLAIEIANYNCLHNTCRQCPMKKYALCFLRMFSLELSEYVINNGGLI